MNDVFWFVLHVVCRFTVSWMQKGLSITHNRSRTHNETLVVSTGIRLVCSDMDRRGVVVLDDVLEVLGGDFSSRKATHPSSPSPADCPSGSHEEDDLLAAIFMMRAPPSRSSNGRPRRSAPSCSQSRGSTLLDSWLIRSTARLQHRQLVFDDLRDARMAPLSPRVRQTASGGRAWVGRAALHITHLSHSHRSARRSTRARSHRWTRWGSLASTASRRRR